MVQATIENLPVPVADYLAAHRINDTAAQITLFAVDATVVDDGRTYDGVEAIEAWMNHSSSEYTYTISPIAVETDGVNCTVTQHLEGNFPGGVVDLRFRFVLHEELIVRLVIEP